MQRFAKINNFLNKKAKGSPNMSFREPLREVLNEIHHELVLLGCEIRLNILVDQQHCHAKRIEQRNNNADNKVKRICAHTCDNANKVDYSEKQIISAKSRKQKAHPRLTGENQQTYHNAENNAEDVA